MTERVYTLFQQSVAAKMQVGEAMAPAIEHAANCIVQAFLQEKKVLVCGNGASAALAQIFASHLVDRFEKERPSLPAIWLGGNMASYTAVVSEKSYDDVYAKPVRALAQSGDILLCISSSGNAQNLVQAASTAASRGVHLISLTGRDGGRLGAYMAEQQGTEIRATVNARSRIHEIHLLIIHCLCDLIDHRLFGID